MFNFLASAFDFSTIFGNLVSEWYKYLILFGVIAIVVLLLFVKKQPKRNNLSSTQRLVYTAILSALSFIANYFTINLGPSFQVSFTITIGFIAGYLLGGGLGFVTAFVGDFLGCILMPFGPYNPFISIGTGLFGLIPGVIFSYFKGNKYLKTVISSILVLVLCTCIINTFGLWLVYGMGKKTFWAYLYVRLPVQAVNWVVNAVLCSIIVTILPKVLPKSKFNLE